jgi:predicted alpha-1,2-mannosidase
MIGDHCISLIGDAYVKGIHNFDIQKAYKAMRQNAFNQPATYNEYKDGLGRRALTSYLKYGYIPLEDSVKEAFHKAEQVSRTLEYAYDDYILSLLAAKWGHKADATLLAERAMNYRNVIDSRTGYVQGRHSDGSFLNENNEVKFCSFITEGTPCHYTWYVPHDVRGLMQCMGGREGFLARLDSMFTQKRYWHGNEPCHQIGYLFNYAGMPWKTQQTVHHIMETEYLNMPGGLSGNDDAGQMSAWYIFSAMGFYPVCPGTVNYVIGTPLFAKLTINLTNGNRFTILAPNVSSHNIYIQSVKWNGMHYNRNYITHDMIMSGGTLEFEMGAAPNKSWGTSTSSLPPSMSRK